MSYAKAVVKLDLTELPTTPSLQAIMDAAVQKWCDETDPSRGAEHLLDVRYYPELGPITSEEVSFKLIDDGELAFDGKSRIIPLTTDYIEKSSTVRLEFTAKELLDLRQGYYYQFIKQGRFGRAVAKVEVAQLPKPRTPQAEATESGAITCPELATVSFTVTTHTPKPQAAITGYLVAFDYR